MVRALLDGSKTQTRRITKPQSDSCGDLIMPGDPRLRCPHGQPGDQLWVRETFQPAPGGGWWYREEDRPRAIKTPWKPSIFMPRAASRLTLEIVATRAERLQDISEDDAWAEGIGEKGKPLAALFNVCMNFPKLNIGRLAADDPSLFGFGSDHKTPTDYEKVTWTNGRGVYAALWESINGPGSWEANPWVWVVEFKRIQH